MKPTLHSRHHRGFTLLETVIAIGVLAVLLTGFMIVFAPAADGIRKSLNIQQADRLASTAELEMVTLRGNLLFTTGFKKAFDWIASSNTADSTKGLLVYQYRGSTDPTKIHSDGTPLPVVSLTNMLPGRDYVVVPMMRRVGDPLFSDPTTGDIAAIEGGIYLVKCTQLVFKSGQLTLGTAGSIVDPKTLAAAATADAYAEAVIAFTADFYIMPAKTSAYFTSTAFTGKFATLKNPVFSRNLAIRR